MNKKVVYFSGKVWGDDNRFPSGFADRVPVLVAEGASPWDAITSRYGLTATGKNSGITTDSSQYPGSQG
jgi:hypothetical protein